MEQRVQPELEDMFAAMDERYSSLNNKVDYNSEKAEQNKRGLEKDMINCSQVLQGFMKNDKQAIAQRVV